MPNAYLEQLRAENEELKRPAESAAPAPMQASSSRDPALPDLSSLKQENDQRWQAKMGVDQAVGDTVSNIANIGTSAVGVGLDMAAGALKDIGVNSVARKALNYKKDMQFNMEEFSQYVDPTDENIIPKLVGRLVPYAAAAYKSKNPGLITSGMAGLQAAGSGDPDEGYLWTLGKQLATMGVTGAANGAVSAVLGTAKSLPGTVKSGAEVVTNPMNALQAGKQAIMNRVGKMTAATPDTRAAHAGFSALSGNYNNLLNYKEENAPSGPSSDPFYK